MFIPVGILSGIVSATVGLASLVSYPALQVLMPSKAANIANTTALICTGIGSGVGSLKELKGHWWEVTKIFVITFVGAILGALMLLHFSNAAFAKIAPFCILIAGFLILLPQPKSNGTQPQSKVARWLAIFAIFLVGIYAGYFSAAAGILMLALLNYTTDESFPVYNAIRNVALLSANIVAIVIFALKADINWPQTLPIIISLGVGLLIGSYIGPMIVRIVPPKVLKIVVAVAAVFMSGYLFWKAF